MRLGDLPDGKRNEMHFLKIILLLRNSFELKPEGKQQNAIHIL